MGILFFLQGIPETIGTLALSLALARIQIRWGPVIMAGAAVSIIGSVIRALPVTLGLHTVAMLLLSVLFITKMTHVSTAKSFIVVTASAMLLLFLELVIHFTLLNIIGINFETIPHDSLKWALIGTPQAVIMLVFATTVSKFKEPLTDGWKK